jgi:hypothetical protein
MNRLSLLRVCLRVACSLAVLFGLIAVASVHWHLWPFTPAVARITGRVIGVEPATIDLGRQPAAAVVSASLVVRNYSDHSIEVIGAETSCSCTAAEGLPATLPPNGQATLPISVNIGLNDHPLNERIVLLVSDNDVVRRVAVPIHADPVSKPGP